MGGVDARCEFPNHLWQVIVSLRAERACAEAKSVLRAVRHLENRIDGARLGDDPRETEHRERRVVGMDRHPHADLFCHRDDGLEKSREIPPQSVRSHAVVFR